MNVEDDDPWLDEDVTAPAVLERNAAQDWDRLSNKFSDAGYRDGIGAGQQSTVQAGFDEGYSQKGVPLGREIGHLRGVSASLLAYLSSSVLIPNFTQEQRNEYTQQTRALVRRLGKFRVAELAGPDLEAEQHAREHGEDVVVPAEVQDKRDMDSLEDSLAGMNGQAGSTSTSQAAKPYEEMLECKEELRRLVTACVPGLTLN